VNVPGDLRISWRLALLILVLKYSRGNKASLGKLHLVNDALRSEEGRNKLSNILAGTQAPPEWPFRVEPALGRAIDMARGERLVTSEGGAAYRLTERGMRAAESLLTRDDVLQQERAFLDSQGQRITENFVKSVIHSLSLS